MKVQIKLHGCDDSTEFEMELDTTELELVKTLSAKSEKASTYGCQPRMVVEEINDIS